MDSLYKSNIMGTINAEHVQIGKGVVIEKGVTITGLDGPAESVFIGDFCYIGEGVKIIVPSFRMGDYTKLNAYSFLHGYNMLQIGRNCWIGGNAVLDSVGGLDIDDNVGIGSHSQIWTHIQFGDIVEGCRYHSNKYMHIEKDAWFVGHCIVSPIKVGEKSMALAGSVVTKDMESNHIYAGVPAKDVSDKLGFQFENRTIEQKANILKAKIDSFTKEYPSYKGKLMVITSPDDKKEGITCFDVSTRTYTKTCCEAEVAFLKKHTPLIKFVPEDELQFLTSWK